MLTQGPYLVDDERPLLPPAAPPGAPSPYIAVHRVQGDRTTKKQAPTCQRKHAARKHSPICFGALFYSTSQVMQHA